jgi:hypothetical protein
VRGAVQPRPGVEREGDAAADTQDHATALEFYAQALQVNAERPKECDSKQAQSSRRIRSATWSQSNKDQKDRLQQKQQDEQQKQQQSPDPKQDPQQPPQPQTPDPSKLDELRRSCSRASRTASRTSRAAPTTAAAADGQAMVERSDPPRYVSDRPAPRPCRRPAATAARRALLGTAVPWPRRACRPGRPPRPGSLSTDARSAPGDETQRPLEGAFRLAPPPAVRSTTSKALGWIALCAAIGFAVIMLILLAIGAADAFFGRPCSCCSSWCWASRSPRWRRRRVACWAMPRSRSPWS